VVFLRIKDDLNPYFIEIFFSIGAFCMVGIILFISKVYFNKDNKNISFISDSSYTIYLLHQPVLLFLSSIFLRIDTNVYLLYPIIASIVFITCFLFHKYIVRRIPLFSFCFNGVLK